MAEISDIKTFLLTYGPRWLTALLILVIGVLISKLSKRWLTRILDRSRISNDHLLRSFFLRSVSLSIAILTTLAALANLNVEVTSIIASLGITGLILGFGLRDTLSNFASGLLLLIYRPFQAGHLIEVEGSQGEVKELTIVNMQMVTTDGVRVIMPNSKVWGSKIVNYSLSDRRRIELTIKVREDDVEPAMSAIQVALSDDPRILKTPAPLVKVTSVTDNTAALSIWVWTNPEDFQKVSADEYLRIFNQLRKAELQLI
jgi:small conductance mechanosensitive channel